MPDPTNDIDALAKFLMKVSESNDAFPWCDPEHAKDWSRALTALVAERNELREQCHNRFDFLKIKELVAEGESLRAALAAAKQRIAELEAQEFTLPSDPFRDADRDLRERLVESALQGSGCRLGIMKESDAEELGRQAAWIVNGALDAMRKGEA